MILLCYDGSSDAQTAIERAGKLLSGQRATVVTVWEPFIDVMTRTGGGLGVGAAPLNFVEIDAVSEQAARERAEEGADRAQRAGMDAQPSTRTREGTIADAILSEADEVAADAIVLGSRGLTGLKSLLLGSVSHALLQHADRMVIVVPSAAVATERAARRS